MTRRRTQRVKNLVSRFARKMLFHIKRARQREERGSFRKAIRGRTPLAQRALRMTGGDLPGVGAGLCRLTKWGKNHHLDDSESRTLCGQPAMNPRPVHFGKSWCVQCNTIGGALEEGS